MKDPEPLQVPAEMGAYIFHYCTEYWTEQEREAWAYFIVSEKSKASQNPGRLQRYIQQGRVSNDPEVLSLLSDGHSAFFNRLVNRIYNEHGHEIDFNFCPECGRVPRTPRAKQCRFCGHDWH